MSTTEPALSAFPSPYSVQTPPGCEGWEEMYPYYALFDERRRVREILRIIDQSDLAELRVETEGFSLHVKKEAASAPGAAPTEPADGSASGPALEDGLVTIPSPMLGTFYRAESPGAAAFVDVGSDVAPDTTVCIIEVMKMMNSVPAGVTGTVVEIAARNGELVEYGAPLFRVRP